MVNIEDILQNEINDDLFGFDKKSFEKKLKENKPYVDDFSKLYPLLEITKTTENGYLEPAYIFDDKIGFHYTIEGIKKSLE
jgi:hypothetical protein